jgi:hypothetical protein
MDKDVKDEVFMVGCISSMGAVAGAFVGGAIGYFFGTIGYGVLIGVILFSSLVAIRVIYVNKDDRKREKLFKEFVLELVEIGKTDGFLSQPAEGKFDENRKHIRARQIGQILNEKGGMPYMQTVFARFSKILPGEARELEVCWGYIGEWLP